MAKEKDAVRDPDENYAWVEFTKKIGDYKKGSTWRLDSSLAAHFIKVRKVARKVKRPEAADRMGPQAGGALNLGSLKRG